MQSSSQTILIVDNDEENHFIVQMALIKNEISNPILFLKDGMALIAYLTEMLYKKWSFPAFILLDLNLPRVNGKEVLRRLKADPTLCCIPIIVLSPICEEKEIRECYRLGANCYIVKPDSFEDIMSMGIRLAHFWFTTVTLPPMNTDIYAGKMDDRLKATWSNLQSIQGIISYENYTSE